MHTLHVPALDPDERAAVRAYLQRAEVRLSTMHRVATALLSGAGIMVLLPAVERDSVVEVLRSLVSGQIDAVSALLMVAVVVTLVVPLIALWLVLRDLTRFYFHANHVRHARGEAFTPRFTLTGLKLPSDELGPEGAAAIEAIRADPRSVELLVPANDTNRARIDRRIASYGGLGMEGAPDDRKRAAALFELAASKPRELLDEVAKVEHGMARHVLRIQVIVLRYVKALVALLTTALAVFASAAVVEGKDVLVATEEAWLAGILMAWAPAAVFAVASPVRWLESQLRSEGATHTAVSEDEDLTQVEDLTAKLALVAFAAAFAAMAVVLPRDAVNDSGRVAGVVVMVLATAALFVVIRGWAGGHPLQRLLRRRA